MIAVRLSAVAARAGVSLTELLTMSGRDVMRRLEFQ